jgi:hypothetical protein
MINIMLLLVVNDVGAAFEQFNNSQWLNVYAGLGSAVVIRNGS